MMGAIGTGNLADGVVTASLGTSGTLYAFASSPVVDPRGEVAGFCDSTDHWLPLACTMNVTLVTELARGLFGWDHGAYDAAARGVAPGADGLLLLPYLMGERTPDLPGGCGVLYGMTADNVTPAHVARAFMEGVTLGMAYGLERLRALGVNPSEIRLTGGGSHSALWREICAAVFGVPVVCLQTGEGAALGAALQAAWVCNREQRDARPLMEFVSEFVRTDESSRVTPSPEAVERYKELAEKARRLRAALSAGGLFAK